MPNRKKRTFAVIVGENVLVLRKKRQLTSEQCAKKLGISRMSLSRLENGVRPALTGDMMDRLAKFFRVRVADLVK